MREAESFLYSKRSLMSSPSQVLLVLWLCEGSAMGLVVLADSS